MAEHDPSVATAAEPAEPAATPVVEAPQAPPSSLVARVQAFRERHARAEIATFFTAGFLFDVLTLDRIDNPLTLAQQAVYLLALGGLLFWEQCVARGVVNPTGKLGSVWRFSEDVIHFLLGSVLSAFSLFYFKSASGVASLVFLVGIFGLLIANELPRFRKLGPIVRVALFSFCLTTYFSILLPVLFGFYSEHLFVLATGAAGGVIFLGTRQLTRWTGDLKATARGVGIPGYGMQILLLALYFSRVIPPVPLSVEQIGIYHSVKRVGGDYELRHQRPWWKKWHRGDQLFLSREGDKVHLFVNVYAPSGFRDQIFIRWSYEDPKRGWIEQKPYPLSIAGTRKEGYRTFATTSNLTPGDHRVQVETSSGHVIGNISFEVTPDSSDAPREFLVDKG